MSAMSELFTVLEDEQPRLFELFPTDQEIDAALERHPSIRRNREPEPAPAVTPFERGMEGSARAAQKWTPEQKAAVADAIRGCAKFLPTFTADDVWDRLPKDFPVTKGLGAALNAAARLGLIRATDTTRKSRRTDDHGHGQRLTVWKSL